MHCRPVGPLVAWGTSTPMRIDFPGNTTSAVLPILSPYTLYEAQVRAENEVDQSGPSNRVQFMTASEGKSS